MREMKDSGIAWIGNIPESWNIIRGKNVLINLSRKVTSTDDVVTCFRDGEVTLRKNRREEGFTFSEKEIGYQGIEPGDLVIHGMDGFAGAIGISDSRGKGSPVLNVCDSKENKLFLTYYLRNLAYRDIFVALSTGIRVRSCDLRWNKIAALPFIVPPREDQDKIVDYLETQCSKVDTLIANQQSQIEKLKSYKQSLITEVVTKGLDKNVPMKDSGIEWIGEIPEHWKMIKFKYVANIKSNLVNPNDYQNYMQVSPENIEKGSGKLLDCDTVENVGVESNNHLFYKGQILYSKVRPILNKVAIAPFDGLCSADMYPIETKMINKFLVYLMLSNIFLCQVKIVTENRVKMPKINQEEISQILLLCPNNAEQENIVSYLDNKCSQIDSLISLKQQKIEKLQQYKKSLIYEYVTGKKEVK